MVENNLTSIELRRRLDAMQATPLTPSQLAVIHTDALESIQKCNDYKYLYRQAQSLINNK
jgi:hypothetical protein